MGGVAQKHPHGQAAAPARAALQIFGPRMAARKFTTRKSAIGLMAKDMGIVQALAREHVAATPVSRW